MPQTQQAPTQNFSLALPVDGSRNEPWGPELLLLTAALQQLDALIVAQSQQSAWCFALDTGSANAYAASYSPAPVLVPGTSLYFKASHANTGASTLAVNGGSAKAITKNGTTALAGAEIALNQIVHVMYDGTQWQLISQ